MASITIPGFTSSYKVPGVTQIVQYGAGARTAAGAVRKCLVFGLKKTSGGTITTNGTPQPVFSTSDADTIVGAGSEAARMLYQALRVPNVALWVACPTPAGGAVAATATITIVSTPPHAATGEWRYRIGGELVSGTVSTTAVQNDIATAIQDAINGKTQLPVSAVASTNVVTLTVKSAGIRGNQQILMQDTTQLPTTVTSTLAGGSAVTGGGVFFTSGAGTEDVDTQLDAISATTFDIIAFAQNDTTNLPKIETWLSEQADWNVGRLQHGVVGHNNSYAAATTLATTTMNAERLMLLAMRYSESHPSELAARFAAYRSVAIQNDPNTNFDNYVLTGIAPQSQDADRWSSSEQNSLLNNGVTPVTTNDDGVAYVVRAITTKCLTSAVPDYRTLDIGRADCPDFAAIQIGLMAETFIAANPRVQDNPPQGARPPDAGIATPQAWEDQLYKLAKDLEKGATKYIPASLPIQQNVDENPPVAEYDPVAGRIMSVFNMDVSNNQHQIGNIVRQTNSG
jgi:phage tail sheath gpL-like